MAEKGTGLLVEKHDDRNYKAEHILGTPEQIPEDLNSCYLPFGDIYDQGKSNHCVAYATTKGHETENVIEIKDNIIFKPRVLTNMMIHDGTMREEGAYLSDGLKAVVKYGSESVNGKNYKAIGYAEIPHDIESIKSYISQGYPIITGLYINDFDRSDNTWKYTGFSSTGGHAIVITGFNDETQELRVTNSWGPGFYDNGNFYIKYNDINFLFEFNIIYDKIDVHYIFTDVTEESWAAESISWCKNNGLVKGYSDGSFRPDQNITRAEMCEIIYNMRILYNMNIDN